ncbi:MAG: UDP-N-acetylmuramoyl-L-alanyl-D-glutamate--2,6-diaminopimelate ligase [bacterium]
MRRLLRILLPKSLKWRVHGMLAWIAAVRFGFPAQHLTVVAVTGTNGKTTVVSYIGQLLRATGHPVGWISTATICINDKETLNATKLTTPSPTVLQATLARMVRAGCQYAVLEASSEGLVQGRLNGIDPEVAVFTNLTPEHIESHGSFEAYAKAKEILFVKLASARRRGRRTRIVINVDDPAAGRYLRYPASEKVGCSLGLPRVRESEDFHLLVAANIADTATGSSFQIDGVDVHTPFVGRFNVMNVLEAITTVKLLGVPVADVALAAEKLTAVPGRMEFLDDLHLSFRILVDYAPEPASLHALYTVLPRFGARRIIHVFGSAGGGRDRARRPILGKFVTEHADVAIITNEDPYDEDPKRILNDISIGTEQASPHKAKVEIILDRREALTRALTLAQEGDLVVVTGKACEQWLMGPRGQRTPWDDRTVLREIARSIPKKG